MLSRSGRIGASLLVVAIFMMGEFPMAGTATFAQEASEQKEIRAVVAGYAESWNRHDIAALADILTDDTVRRDNQDENRATIRMRMRRRVGG